ncbi:hypothetical protein J7643_05995 [bacterium]|nr:hypothetical protein [bacterium]
MKRISLLLVACLCACQPSVRPIVEPPQIGAASQEPASLWGRVSSGYAAQATAGELVAFATVTLLDGSNTVVATGLTDGTGTFSLNPFVSWAPVTNTVYVLEALKSFDKTNDRAQLRFRTLVAWDGAKWRSLSGTTTAQSGGAGVLLNGRTTALAAIKDLRALSGTSLLDALDPTTGVFTPAAGVTTSEVDTVAGLVSQALASNLDPVKWLTYANGAYALTLGAQMGRVLFDLEDALSAAGTGSTFVPGRDGGQALAFSTAVALYDGQVGSRGSGQGQLDSPIAVASDRSGTIWVADWKNNRFQRFTSDGRFLSTFGSLGTGAGKFDSPHGISIDADGNFLTSELYNFRLQKFDPQGNLLFGIGQGSRWTVPPAPASGSLSHEFWNPSNCLIARDGTIWTADGLNARIIRYSADGTALLQTFGSGFGTGPGQLNIPTGFAIAPNGDVYICDRSNHRIQRFASNGAFVAEIGKGLLTAPDDVKFDNAGNFWVSEYSIAATASRVVKFDPNGELLGTFGSLGYGDGQFRAARGMTFAPDGKLWVIDYNNHRLQRLIPANAPVVFPAKDRFNATRGTISFWFKPTWNGSDGLNHCFVRVQGGTETNFGVHKLGNQLYFYATSKAGDDAQTRRVGFLASDTAALIKAGRWHHLAAVWDGSANDVRLYLDGRAAGSLANDNPAATLNFVPGTTVTVGADANKSAPADAVIDQLRIRDVALSSEAIARAARGLEQE